MTRRALSARQPLALGFAALVVLVLGFGGWATFSTISGAVVAPGRIEVEQNRQAVQHPDGGLVAEVAVREGDRVAAGAVLLRLDATALASELAIVEGEYFELMARRGRLEAEQSGLQTVAFDPVLLSAARAHPDVAGQMQGQSRLLEARNASVAGEVEQLGRRREQIATQIGGIRAQETAIRTQITLVAEERAGQQSLYDRGLAEAGRLLALRREEARLQGILGELVATEGQAAERITEVEIEVLRIGTRIREEAIAALRNLQFRELELAERRRALATRLSRLDIRAPVAGVIHGLVVFGPGAVVRPAEPVAYLVPQDRPLVITSRIPANDIDEVLAGQAVTLRFPALDRHAAPEIEGRVTRLSADAFADEVTGQRYYRAEIVPAEGEIGKLVSHALLPGMPVDAYIRTAESSPLSYLIAPLAAYFTRAFRES